MPAFLHLVGELSVWRKEWMQIAERNLQERVEMFCSFSAPLAPALGFLCICLISSLVPFASVFLVPPLHQLDSTRETYFCSSLVFSHLHLFIKCETRIIALHSPIKFGTGARKDWAQRTILFSFPQIKNLDYEPIVISSYMMLVYQYFYCNKDLII